MKQYRNTAFLIELLVNVLVLSISCAILVQVLVQASLTVADTNRKNAAGNEIHSLLETARVRGLGSVGAEEGFSELFYDEDWQVCAEDEAAYVVTFEVEDEVTAAGTLQHVSARADKATGGEICAFTSAFYRPKEEVA